MAQKKNGPGGRLGIRWKELKVGKMIRYDGSISGIKNNVSRANKLFTPFEYAWERRGKTRRELWVGRIT